MLRAAFGRAHSLDNSSTATQLRAKHPGAPLQTHRARRRAWLPGNCEGLPDCRERDAFLLISERGPEALDRLVHRLVAEPEGLVMNRQDVFRASFIGHRHCFLRIAVAVDPWIVSADRHDQESQRAGGTQLM